MNSLIYSKEERVGCLFEINDNLLAIERHDFIDFRMINSLELVKSFETEMGYLNAFCKNKSYLFFGCREGLLILDHSLNRVK